MVSFENACLDRSARTGTNRRTENCLSCVAAEFLGIAIIYVDDTQMFFSSTYRSSSISKSF